MPTVPTQQQSKAKNASQQAQTQSTGSNQEVEQNEISWKEVDKLEQQARKEREQDEPTLKANARRTSDAFKERQNSM
ncbi:hypothetical protein NQZ79_g5340 [Umbelopsis isabellina]|nr:hypothetical protein NQZ79_g5340 [Umbelopsis isabellina]